LSQQRDYQLYSDAIDRWSYAGTNYQNEYCTVFRWREAYQYDFQARMDRCVRGFADVNHAPRAVVNGDTTLNVLRQTTVPGTAVNLDAAGSLDPDDDQLSYSWWVYPEAGTYAGSVSITGATTSRATVTVPADAQGKDIHVILTLSDNGSPRLTGYRRVVITGGTPTSANHIAARTFERSPSPARTYSLDGRATRAMSGADRSIVILGDGTGARATVQVRALR
jgi:hypothetical protein